MGLRKNQASLSTAEKGAFVEAVLAQKQRPSLLHPGAGDRSRYDDFVEVHLNAMAVMMQSPPAPSWGHMAAAFGPWHRVLLLKFEKELQTVDATVTIPYWDWTVERRVTSDLWTAGFLGGNGTSASGEVTDGQFAAETGRWPITVKDNPDDADFLRRQLGAQPDAKNLPLPTDQSDVLGLTPYDAKPWDDMLRDQEDPAEWGGFRIGLETSLHNLVHRWVGGTMLDMSSPNDPVFWLHHCNIDRLWSVWQFAHPTIAGYLPGTGGPHGHNLDDAMVFHAPGDNAPWNGDFHPADVLDHRTLGITYDTDPVDAPAVIPPTPEPVQPSREIERGRARTRLPMFALPREIAALRGKG